MMGIRDEDLLDSALSNPFQSFDGKDLYPTVQAKAAQLCYGLVKNHAAGKANVEDILQWIIEHQQ